MSFFAELKRRNVVKVGLAYLLMAWVLLQAGDFALDLIDAPNWVIQSLSIIVGLGFPVVLVFSWVFEMTPEGLRLERDIDRGQSITRETGRKLNTLVITLLVLAVSYLALDKWVLEPASGPEVAGDVQPSGDTSSPGTPGHSIAVLPLADMSPDGDHEYFSDGLTEELLNILVRIQDLKVAGRTSSFAFKGKNEDLREIGRKLNVEHILEGSVRKDESRNRVRITLQLISADDGYHLWSETYDRELDDIFAIQEEVAHEVADALRITLLGEDEARLKIMANTDVDSYDLFLQGRQQLKLAGYINLSEAERLFNIVLSKDPDFVPARLALTETWGQMALTGALSSREALDRGLPVLQSILEADPGNVEALRLRGQFHSLGFEHELAFEQFEKAMELDPYNASVLNQYGRALFEDTQITRGVALMDRAMELEPYDPMILWDNCKTNGHLGKFDKALVACLRIQELSPNGPQGYYGEAVAHLYQGRLPETIKGYVEATVRDPEDFEMLAATAMFWSALGDREQARLWLGRAEALGAGQPIPTYARIMFLELQEQYDQSGRLANQTIDRQMEDRHGSNFLIRRSAATQAARTAQWESGIGLYTELIPWAFETELVIPEDAALWIEDLIHLAGLMRQADPLAERPSELLAFAEANVDDYHPSSGTVTPTHRQALIHLARGDTAAGLEKLREMKAYGLYPYWRQMVMENPVMVTVRQDPGYQSLMEEYQTLAEEERLRARALMELDG